MTFQHAVVMRHNVLQPSPTWWDQSFLPGCQQFYYRANALTITTKEKTEILLNFRPLSDMQALSSNTILHFFYCWDWYNNFSHTLLSLRIKLIGKDWKSEKRVFPPPIHHLVKGSTKPVYVFAKITKSLSDHYPEMSHYSAFHLNSMMCVNVWDASVIIICVFPLIGLLW